VSGARRPLTDQVATGLEITGTLEGRKERKVFIGLFADPLPWLTVNVGIGTGLTTAQTSRFEALLFCSFASQEGQRRSFLAAYGT
jgi:hypothetical protein